MKKKVVTIGGGNGSAKSINSCKQLIDDIELSAIVSMSDDGGSSGRLREEFDTLPPGDILRAVMAMSRHDYEMLKSIFYTPRFAVEGKLNKHDLGNMFLVLAAQYTGDYIASIRALEQALDTVGHVYPVTLDKTQLAVRYSNGEVVISEDKIDRPQGERTERIVEAWLEPTGVIHVDAQKKIIEADYIVLSPGSLYCSVIATMLCDGFKDAVQESNAHIIFLAGNSYEGHGELGPTKLSDMVHELEQYLPRKVDTVVYCSDELNEQQKQWYAEKKWVLFEADIDQLKDYTIVQGPCDREDRPGLSSRKIGELLKQVIV